MPNVLNDPDFKEGWDSQTAPGVSRFFKRLGQAIRDTPGDIVDLFGTGGPQEGGGSEGPRPDLGREIGEFATEFREGGVPNATGGQTMDVGREDYGVDVPMGGTPRVSPSERGTNPNYSEGQNDWIRAENEMMAGERPEGFVLRMTDELQQPREEERSLQAALQRAGYSPGAVDGFAGPNTLSALNKFLEDAGVGLRVNEGDEIPGWVMDALVNG